MSIDGVEDGRVEEDQAAVEAFVALGVRRSDPATPRSEAVKFLSPAMTAESLQTIIPASDYFGVGAADCDHLTLPALSRTASATPVSTALAFGSDMTATGTQQSDAASSLRAAEERPTHHSHISNHSAQSGDSNATITAPNGSASAPSTMERRPAFPNQSYAALHSQQYPVRPHAPPMLRPRSSHPGQIYTFASALASLHQSGTRTVGNSPAATPGVGLFSPQSAPPPEGYDTYASPFLHFTHRQQPKETHVADVDVDPISGRKLINHYEIIDELGRGMHGKVKLGRDLQTENTHVAIKIVERYSKRRKLGKIVSAAEDKVKKEVAILKKARHPNIVALLEVIDDPSRKKVYIVLEWVERGEILWRTKTAKEIGMVEARRYERERSGERTAQTDAEDEAVLLAAQRRLSKEKRVQLRAAREISRRMQELGNDPQAWSNETSGIGDTFSEESEDDRLSRISTSTTLDSAAGVLAVGERRLARTSSPLPPTAEDTSRPTAESPTQYLPLTAELQTMSPIRTGRQGSDLLRTGLEGTMYGPYSAVSSSEQSRVNSLSTSVHEADHISQANAAIYAHVAKEILDSDLNPELQYAPVLTMQQARVAFRDTLIGLQYLHFQGIVHRDIKPPNLLATIDHRVKISDFGASYLGRPLYGDELGEEVSEHEAQDFDEAKELAKTVGTPAFYAPELCIAEPGVDPLPVTKAIDVWALGITLFCMLFARTPFVDNEFVVMRQIADEEIYIPRKRLLPVNEQPVSRPTSNVRAFPPVMAGRRLELDIVYEDINDELFDLLKRLLTKDPRKRITLEEVRHHAWVVADLPNKIKWLEETDTARQSHGKKIEISNEEVSQAVVPLQFLDRVRSGVRKIGERLGLSTRSGRNRTQSNAGIASNGIAANPAGPSAGSSSTTLSYQEERRKSIRGNEQIFSALTASIQGEHPLSRSVAASPELETDDRFFDHPMPGPYTTERAGLSLGTTPSRPSLLERSQTHASTTGSIRTLKQCDMQGGRESPPPSPGLPETPIALASPGVHALQAILGSGTRRVLQHLRERSSPRGSDVRGRSSERQLVELLDTYGTHGEASLAVSHSLAAGHLNLPEALQDMSSNSSAPSSRQNSPVASRSQSVVSSAQGRLRPALGLGTLSRNSSGGSIQSIGRFADAQNADISSIASAPQLRPAPESSAADWQRADDERLRKLIREGEAVRTPSVFDERNCPPSPDDQPAKRPGFRPLSVVDICQPASHETSPTSHGAHLPPSMVSSSSDFGSGFSMSMSNPSIPSVISEASSVDESDDMPSQEFEDKLVLSDDTLHPPPDVREDHYDEEHTPDIEQALDSENDEAEYDSSSDSDGGLVMTRRKSKNSSFSTASLGAALSKDRRGTGLSMRSKKSSRSGSNNTMKKVRTRDSEDERRSGTLMEE
ncbi:hypothetical protein LTR08_003424 [Meristemomyces frigidus]|nr:hypothetical protein LTR08_003424 [Meristemomyces frigidus]